LTDFLVFLAKRLAWLALTVWIVYTLSYALMRSVPGGPYSSERKLNPAAQRNFEKRHRLDLPVHQQYFHDMAQIVFHFDFGQAMKLDDFTVKEVIAQGFPISASLGIFAMVFALALGTTAGVVSATRRQSGYDVSLMILATVGIAVPNFVLASLAIIVFVFLLGLLPAAGWGRLDQLILPALCIGAPYAAYIARLTRTGMLEVLGLDYIRTAYAKGLGERRVVVRHALRGAMLPVVSYLGPATAGVLTGSLVLERIFAIPGMGSHFIEAATQRDYTTALGVITVYTLLLLTMNTLVDISYSIIDPRVKIR
jgi:ABC-type dipeptide/oligopeptide/nickel transport system permease component